MRGATRYTARGTLSEAAGRLLLRLVMQPGTALAAAALALTDRPVIAGLVWLGSAAAVMTWRCTGAAPRVQRAMGEVGLICRREDGRVEVPRPRGWRWRWGRNVRLRFRLPAGVTLRDVLDRQEAIEQRCCCELACWMEDGLLHLEVLRHRIPRLVEFSGFYRSPRPGGRLLIGLGFGRRGALWADLASLPHLLVGGMTGGGKSVFLRQALTFIGLEYRPDRVRLILVDLKGGVELAHFGELPHALRPVADTVEGAAAALAEVRAELDSRLEALRRAQIGDIDGWSDAGMPRWPRIVVVVDELAELTARDWGVDRVAREAQQAARARLVEISRLGRAVGIHLIVCTQRPDADVVPGQLKANLAGTVAFRVRAGVNSLILLDSDRAALLPPHPGRAVWAEERIEEFQAVHVSLEESRRLLEGRWGASLMSRATVEGKAA
jgi:DNA segregation ATPase FtsK/SpoIIIE-like protein